MHAPQVTQPGRDFVSFSDLLAKVGYFLLNWSTLELSLSDAIFEKRPARTKLPAGVSGTFAERLELWRRSASRMSTSKRNGELVGEIAEQASRLRTIRNLIVHGLVGGNSLPEAGPGYIECVVGGYDRPTGEFVRYTVHDLENFAQAADACRRGFRDVDSFNHRLS